VLLSGSPPIQAPQAVLPQARGTVRTWDYLWPVIGLVAVALSGWLLFREIHHLSWADVKAALAAIPAHRWGLALAATMLAYGALAWYDRIGLLHLGFPMSWPFISAVSFTAYALSHNIGMTMFSGGMVRYRAYSTRGLTLPDVGVLVAFCSFTFGLGTVLLGGLLCLAEPAIFEALFDVPTAAIRVAGAAMLGGVLMYLGGSALHLRPLVFRGFRVEYPRPGIVARQLVAGPLELIGAAGIIYCALPATLNPGFPVVLGIFLASFTAALLSHAPGGLGVLELVFLAGMPGVPQADVLAALLVFRLLYLVVPLGLGIAAVLIFERGRLARTLDRRGAG
jgi:glycosyltransferase 2 family protein